MQVLGKWERDPAGASCIFQGRAQLSLRALYNIGLNQILFLQPYIAGAGPVGAWGPVTSSKLKPRGKRLGNCQSSACAARCRRFVLRAA